MLQAAFQNISTQFIPNMSSKTIHHVVWRNDDELKKCCESILWFNRKHGEEVCSWPELSHLLHRPPQSHFMKTDFPFPFPCTSGKSVKGALCCPYLCTNTQQSSHSTDEHNTGTYKRCTALSFCLVHRKPHQNYLLLQTTKITRSVESELQISDWHRFGKVHGVPCNWLNTA